MADQIYRTARRLLDKAVQEGPFRLIGVGISNLVSDEGAHVSSDLLDPDANKRANAERARDEIRKKFGRGAIIKGRSL